MSVIEVPSLFDDVEDMFGNVKGRVTSFMGGQKAVEELHEKMMKKNCDDISMIARTVTELIDKFEPLKLIDGKDFLELPQKKKTELQEESGNLVTVSPEGKLDLIQRDHSDSDRIKSNLLSTMGEDINNRMSKSRGSQEMHCSDQIVHPTPQQLLGQAIKKRVKVAKNVTNRVIDTKKKIQDLRAPAAGADDENEEGESLLSIADYHSDILGILPDKIDEYVDNLPVPDVEELHDFFGGTQTRGRFSRKSKDDHIASIRTKMKEILHMDADHNRQKREDRKKAIEAADIMYVEAAKRKKAAEDLELERFFQTPAAGTSQRTSLPRASKRGSHTEAPNISAFELWEKYSPMDKENFKMMMIENPKIFSPGVEEEADREPWAEAETGEIFDKYAPLSTELTKTEFKGALADLRLGGGGIINTKIRNKVKMTKRKSKVKMTKRKSKVKRTKRKSKVKRTKRKSKVKMTKRKSKKRTYIK